MGEYMETIKWNKLQVELFEKLMDSNDISLVEVMERLDQYINVWENIFNVLIESSEDIDKYSSLRGIYPIVKDNINYLFIKVDIWDYIIIDIDNEVILSKDEILKLFDEDFFVGNLGEEKIGINNYYFMDIIDNKLKYLIYTYINNEELLVKNPYISYYIVENDTRVGIEINLIKGSITLCFNDLASGRANYLFFDKKLNALGVSNPSGNMEELKIMTERFKNVMIPFSVVKEYIKDKELENKK